VILERLSVLTPNQSDDDEKWWRKWKWLSILYHPLLQATDEEYVLWIESKNKASPSRRLIEQQIREAEKTVAPFGESLQDIVGCEDLIDEILSSVHYWVFKDDYFKSVCPAPPPKIFIIKGSSGMGKTLLVRSAIYRAFLQGKQRSIPVYANTISPHKIYEKWLGESEKRLAKVFDEAFLRPTIIFIDEAHSFAQRQNEAKASDSGMQAYLTVQTTLLEKVNELMEHDCSCILILATNEFGSISEAVRRRGSSGTIDLDSEVSREVLLAVARKNIEKYKLKNLEPLAVLNTIEEKVHALGHGTVTPADISNAFQIVIEKKTKHIRSSYIRKLAETFSQRDQAPLEISLQDFRNIRELKEYDEDRRSEDVRQIITKVKPKISLDDVGGLSGIKEQLLKDMEVSLDVEQARKLGATPIRGVLLHGPPGCGKTWLAQAMAGELNATIYMIKGAQVIKPYHGQTEKIISDVFDEARKNAPSIIIIDEIDVLTLKRDLGGNLGAVTTLLSEMGGLKPLEGVVVVATTNKIQLVDEAFLRSGRFDRIIEILPPKNDTERVEIIKVHLRKCASVLDPSVKPEQVLELFGKRTMTPARIERTISDAIELRIKELSAVYKLEQAMRSDAPHLKRVKQIYNEELKRLRTNLKFSSQIPVGGDELPEETIRGITPENYKLTLSHFKSAIELSHDERIEEIRRITATIRGPAPKPTVGKVYGVAALNDPIGEVGTFPDGAIAVIECVCNPYAKRGKAVVIGSEVADSVKASAEHARVFLNEQCKWKIRNYEFFLDFITFAKGLDTKVIQGPSAGAAITLAQFSVAACEPVLPNVVITGGVTPKGELVQVGGLDFRGMGKFVAALSTEGVDTMIIPEANLLSVSDEDRRFFERQGLSIVGAMDFWDIARVAIESHPDKESAIRLLIDRATSNKGNRTCETLSQPFRFFE
jgi:SpoVK/Ycf46/Vps4 family AAA+-type ATPase